MKLLSFTLPFACALVLTGCSNTPPKSPDVTDNVRRALDQAGLKDVSVSQDRDKGIVTLDGHVPTDSDKLQAEALAKSIAGSQVVADQIGVRPPGEEGMMKSVDADLDKAIDKNLDAVLIQNKMDKDVSYTVKNGLVTLKGEVNSQVRRSAVERLAGTVPNVKQVVNNIQIKGQKATSTTP